MNHRQLLLVSVLLVAIIGYWLLPISGKVMIMMDSQAMQPPWPRLRFEPAQPQPGETAVAVLADETPWVYVELLVDGQQEGQFVGYNPTPFGYGEWSWAFTVPEADSYQLSFYHDCDRGCNIWAEHTINNVVNLRRFDSARIPTKLGLVFAHPGRNWHNRSGWVVELTYARQATAPYWGIDDLAKRVETAVSAGHRVLVRVDYDQEQSIPPDEETLAEYLVYLRQLARDGRFQGVYGYIIGSSYNATNSNIQTIRPEWYARVFNGYGTLPTAPNNVVAAIRAENSTVRVLVGPVQPWVTDMDGERPFTIPAPWLNYFYTVLTFIDEAAQERAATGISQAWPDGFTVQAFGGLNSADLLPTQHLLEPQLNLPHPQWPQAQAGFQVYQDWLAVINSFATMQAAPVYITASNTHQPGSPITPAQNYPAGWLTAAFAEINQEPQVAALCWFVDYLPVDEQWALYSLSNPQGSLVEASAEFDGLLEGE